MNLKEAREDTLTFVTVSNRLIQKWHGKKKYMEGFKFCAFPGTKQNGKKKTKRTMKQVSIPEKKNKVISFLRYVMVMRFFFFLV